jgi:iron-sulfur cluster assembly accessory protein
MITLTKEAIETVRRLKPYIGSRLRLYVQGGGCSGFQYGMNFESAADTDNLNDTVFTFDDVQVVVDQKSNLYLDGIEIGYHSDLTSSGFTFNNPNAKSNCGCGKSFGA